VGRGAVENNLIYANTNRGVLLSGNGELVNNTVDEDVGDAVHVVSSGYNVSLRNNVLAAQAGAALSVVDFGTVLLSSDDNAFYATGAGELGRWQDRVFTRLADWQYEVQQDAIAGPPTRSGSTATVPTACGASVPRSTPDGAIPGRRGARLCADRHVDDHGRSGNRRQHGLDPRYGRRRTQPQDASDAAFLIADADPATT